MPRAGLSEPALALLHEAVADEETVARFRAKTRTVPGTSCLWWTGAVSARGHGRFWIGQIETSTEEGPKLRDVVVIAHRFAYALEHGVVELESVPVLGHRCDNPLCQKLGSKHVQVSTHARNRQEWAARRHTIGNPLRDSRGARGRAKEIRDIVRRDASPQAIAAAVAQGLRHDAAQLPLWAELVDSPVPALVTRVA